MKRNRMLPVLGLILAGVLIISVACTFSVGDYTFGATKTPTPTMTFTPTMTPTNTPTPTATPVPTNTPTPKPVAGIDEMVSTGGLEVKVIDAFFADSFDLGNGQTVNPNAGFVLYIVKYEVDGDGDLYAALTGEWQTGATIESSSHKQYFWEHARWSIEGKKTYMWTVFAPKIGDDDFTLTLPDGTEVELYDFFSDD